jgi:CubicO group peptidase (beta-lactamase class C family)
MIRPSARIDRRCYIGLTAAASAAIASPFARRWGMEGQVLAAEPPAPTATQREDAITATMEELSIPGANVLLDRPDSETGTAAFGVSELKQMTPMGPEMHMRIGSITKTMTGTLVLQLIDDGALSFDDTLARMLPDMYRGVDAPLVRQVLARGLVDCVSSRQTRRARKRLRQRMASRRVLPSATRRST